MTSSNSESGTEWEGTLIGSQGSEEQGNSPVGAEELDEEAITICGDICCNNTECRAALASGGDPETISMLLYMKEVRPIGQMRGLVFLTTTIGRISTSLVHQI